MSMMTTQLSDIDVGNFIRPGHDSNYTDIDNTVWGRSYGDADYNGDSEYSDTTKKSTTRRRQSKDDDDDDDDSDNDSDNDDDDNDSDDDDDNRGRRGKSGGIINYCNKYSGVASVVMLLILIMLLWMIYNIRKDICLMFDDE